MTHWTKWPAFRLAVVGAAVLGVAFAGATAGSVANESRGRDVAPATAGLHAPSDAGTAPDEGEASGALSVLAHGDDDDDGHMMGDWDWNGWWIIMPIMMVLFWGGVIAVAVWGIRQFTRGRDRGQSPLDIARERYAKGEITAEEFEKLRRDLS